MAERALATAFVNIVPGTKDLETYLKTGLSSQGVAAGGNLAQGMSTGLGSKLKGTLMPVLGSLGLAFGAVGVARFGRDMYESAQAGQKTDAVLSNISKSMGLFGDKTDTVVARLQDYATAQMKLTGIDDDLIKGAQSKLMTFSAVAKSADTMGGAFDRATGLAADLSAAGFGSLDSASVMLGKALQDPLKGVTALQRVGVSLSDSQKQQVKDFMKVNDVAGAQKIILDEVSRQVGGTAEASATAGEKMSARWDDAVQSLGTTLMPVFDGIISFVNDTFVPAMEGASGSVKGFLGWFGDNQSWLLPTLAGIGAVLLGIAVNTAAMGISAAVAAAGGLPAIIAATWAWTAALLANPVTWIVLGIGLLVAAIVALAMNWDKVTKWVKTVWAGFTGWISDSLKNISKWWNDTWTGVGNFLRDAWNNIVKAVSTGVSNTIKFFTELPGKIIATLAGAGKWLLDVGKNLIQGLLDGAGSLLKNIGSFFLNMLPGWIKEPFKAALGIHSPSRVFIEFGKNIIQGLLDGLTGDKKSVMDTMQKVADWVTNAFTDGKIYKKTAQSAQKLVAVYTAMLAPIAAAHDDVMKKLNDAQDVLAGKIQERLNYIKTIAEKYGSKLSQSDGMTAAAAIQQLKDRIAKTKELAKTMADLAKLGLSGDLYQQILDSGNLEFAQSILAGGDATVKELNSLADEANATAMQLGTQAGDILFNKGIEVAQGIVDGLKSKESELSALMANLAQAFSNAVTSVIQNDTRQADTAAVENAKTAAAAAQKAYDAAVKKYGKNSSQAKGALTALTKANTAVTTANATLNSGLRAGIAQPVNVGTGELGTIGTASAQTVNYFAAPNSSLDSEQALTTAMQRARLV